MSNRDSNAFSFYNFIDLGINVAATFIFLFYAAVHLINVIIQLKALSFAEPDIHVLSGIFSRLTIGLFSLMMGSLYILRSKAQRKSSGVLPRITAVLGTFLLSGLMFLPQHADLPLLVQIAGSLFVIAGYIFAIYAISHLGRSFSILPESRKLVTSGPYRIIRHPLYLAEALGSLGVLISFASIAAAALVITQFALQIARTYYEERILSESFPEYKTYMKHTARFIPRIY